MSINRCGKIIKLGSAVHVIVDGTGPIILPVGKLNRVLAGDEVPLRRIEPHPESDCEIVRAVGACRLYGAGKEIVFSIDGRELYTPAAGIQKLIAGGCIFGVPLTDTTQPALYDTGLRAGFPRNFGE